SSPDSISFHRAHSLSRCAPVAAAATTRPRQSAVTTDARGSACKFSHHAGSAAPQPFMATTTKLDPSTRYPTITDRGSPVRLPVVVNRSVPHPPGLGNHTPTLPKVTKYRARCIAHATRMNQRGGSLGGSAADSDIASLTPSGLPPLI